VRNDDARNIDSIEQTEPSQGDLPFRD